ncbi:hypothetical protein [Nonomuraea sp. NPDC050643]|uniref:hypothetical protein n=1 Tax=Nonomuraea sp. NPDC050643 TaxID=3155660 RepID=UPI0033D9070C
MRRTKKIAATLAIAGALVGGGLTLGTPAWAAGTPAVAASATADDIWWIYNFYPDSSTCEGQRRWGASQGWWTFDRSACATNGREWALFIRGNLAPSSGQDAPDLPKGWRSA